MSRYSARFCGPDLMFIQGVSIYYSILTSASLKTPVRFCTTQLSAEKCLVSNPLEYAYDPTLKRSHTSTEELQWPSGHTGDYDTIEDAMGS